MQFAGWIAGQLGGVDRPNSYGVAVSRRVVSFQVVDGTHWQIWSVTCGIGVPIARQSKRSQACRGWLLAPVKVEGGLKHATSSVCRLGVVCDLEYIQ